MTNTQKTLAAAELISKAVKILRGLDGEELELARRYANRARRTIEKTAFEQSKTDTKIEKSNSTY